MRAACVQAYSSTSGGRHIVLVEVTHGDDLTPYEFDHLGGIVTDYLCTLGFDRLAGAKSIRGHLTDEELELEADDFMAERGGGE